MNDDHSVVLVGMSVREAVADQTVVRLADELGVTHAYLQLGDPSVSTELTRLRSSAWQDVPRHRHQLLLCRGPRCTVAGSDKSAEAFVQAMMRRGLEDDDVLITHTGCQFPCNNAPVVSVQPDDVWYGAVDANAAERIVVEHLIGDRPVESHRLPRERSGPRTDGGPSVP